MAYRTAEIETPMLVKRWWARPVCWLIGHKWYVLGINTSKNSGLAHLHPDAGIDQFCTRCGVEWYDGQMVTHGFQRDPRDKEPIPPKKKLKKPIVKKPKRPKRPKTPKPPTSPWNLKMPPMPPMPKMPKMPKMPDFGDGIFDSTIFDKDD